MRHVVNPNDRNIHWMRNIARIIAILWAGWSTFFLLATGIHEGLNPGEILLWVIIPGVLFLISLFIAWRWTAIGGPLLIIEGIIILSAYSWIFEHIPMVIIVSAWLVLGAPPLVSGILFTLSWWLAKKRPTRSV